METMELNDSLRKRNMQMIKSPGKRGNRKMSSKYPRHLSPGIIAKTLVKHLKATMQGIAVVAVGPDPIFTVCPNCHSQVRTVTDKEASSKAFLCCGLLFLFGCWLCCWVPFCMDSFNNVVHRCPNCKAFVGQYSS